MEYFVCLQFYAAECMHVEQVFGADVYQHPFYLPWLLFSISIKILNGSMQCNPHINEVIRHLIIYHAEPKKGQALKIESERKRVCWIKRLHTFGELQLNDDGSCKRFSNFFDLIRSIGGNPHVKQSTIFKSYATKWHKQ